MDSASPADDSLRPGSAAGRGRLAAVAVLIGCLALVVVSMIGAPTRPFDPDSSAPDGYRALRLVLEEQGITVGSHMADDQALVTVAAGTVVVVAEPGRLDGDQLALLADAALRGATIVHGSVPPSFERLDREESSTGPDVGVGEDDGYMDRRSLVETPGNPLETGRCTIEGLDDLGWIDVVAPGSVSLPLPPTPAWPADVEVRGTCYGNDVEGQFAELSAGAGNVFVLGSPYLWVNARLKADVPPSETTRGDNGSTAWRILSGAATGDATTEVVFIDPPVVRADGTGGTQGLFELLPVPFKAALGLSVTAAVMFIWSRAVRLGRPVVEELPVTIESSSMTRAVGRLFMDDRAFIERGAESIRRSAIDSMIGDLGLGPGADPSMLCTIVASRTGRDVTETQRLLYGPLDAGTLADVIDLERTVERLRMEVGHGRSR